MRRPISPRRSPPSVELNDDHERAPEPEPKEVEYNIPENVTIPPVGAGTHDLLKKCPPGSLPANVHKELLHVGLPTEHRNPPYPDGTRVRLHYKVASMSDGHVFDDSRKHPKPFELLLGKKFKIEIWELALNTMFVREVAKFIVPKEYCFFYPMVARVLRDTNKEDKDKPKKTNSHSCCAHALSGTGYDDLDQLMSKPKNLVFTFELLEVSLPGEFNQEAWYMTDAEKAASIEDLHQEGNKLYTNCHYKSAGEKYLEALSRLEQLIIKEAPGSSDFKYYKKRQVPFLMNYAICLQKTLRIYEAIKYNNMALEIEPDNVKALYRRATCYRETAYYEEARKDYNRVKDLDTTMTKIVDKDLQEMHEEELYYRDREKHIFRKMLAQREADKAEGKEVPPLTHMEKQKKMIGDMLEREKAEVGPQEGPSEKPADADHSETLKQENISNENSESPCAQGKTGPSDAGSSKTVPQAGCSKASES